MIVVLGFGHRGGFRVMTIVVGYLPAKGGRASLDLAAVLARSGVTEHVAVVTVVPRHWTTPSMAKVDAEFAAWSHQLGEDALDQARRYLTAKWPDVAATFQQTHGRSVPSALIDACDELSGNLLVLGSSTDGRVGQIIVGSTATPLLHSSEVPIAIAPRGYRAAKGSALGRLTCSFAATEESADLLTATAQLSATLGCPLRIVTFGVRGRTMYPPEVGLHAEDQVLAQWREQVQTAQEAALARLNDLDLLPGDATATTSIATGGTWGEAMDEVEWEAGEVLVVGSSRVGRLARVFLGSAAIKIVRYSPVPVVVVPAAVAAEVAEAAGLAEGGEEPHAR
jgi:nucleotide-binding universal stress UspA family protein